MRKIKLSLATLMFILFATGHASQLAWQYDTWPNPEGGFDRLEHSIEFPDFPDLPYWETSVTLCFRVNVDGSISNVQVLESGGAAYDEAAIQAVSAIPWSPATIDGQPIPVRFTQPFLFRRQ